MSRTFLYKITRDYGFAPNPFGKYCSLATCKPKTRNVAQVNDWVIGLGAVENNYNGRLICAMKIDKIITFQEYWSSKEFQYKKPVMNGSLKVQYGDNIYHQENGEWLQENSHHSLDDGKMNQKNFKNDTSSLNVLISSSFYYFGKNAPAVPDDIAEEEEILGYLRNHKDAKSNRIIEWITDNFEEGYHGDPIEFDKNFERYTPSSGKK